MNSTRFIKLTDFTIQKMAEPIPQQHSIDMFSYAYAKYMMSNLPSDSDFKAIFSEASKKTNYYALSPDQIRHRQLVGISRLIDASPGRFEDVIESIFKFLFDEGSNFNGADIGVRQKIFEAIVKDCLDKMYNFDRDPPDDIIHVTCSGYLAPSPVAQMVSRNLWTRTRVTNIYHMGCYAAFPAIRTAHGFLSSSSHLSGPKRKAVDVVHTEISSLHHNITDQSASNIIVSTLFSDGFVKYSVVWGDDFSDNEPPALKIKALYEHLLPDSIEDMTHHPGPFQFSMTLTPRVPAVVKRSVVKFVDELLLMGGVDLNEKKDRLLYAIHPGGPKIVEHVQQALNASDDQVRHGKSIFFEHGNMSSATIPHIFKAILDDDKVERGAKIVSLAFGPGLTITGALLEKV